MAEGILINIAESLVMHLASTTINEIASTWGFHARLTRLQQTVNTIKDVLLDAEEKQLHSHAVRGWVQRLKAVVYEADDLFDEFSTIASRKKAIQGNKFIREVTSFFSSTSNQIKVSFSISDKIKNIMEKLDEIDQDGKRFAFVIHSYEEPRVLHREGRETYSFVDVEQVVGREDDMEVILAILDGYQDQRVCVVPIVGIGGLGKTALAQLLYNQIEKSFDLSMWVSVSDDFDIKYIVRKILKSATKKEPQNLELDQLQKELQSQISGKKYLLVLDDVWNDNVEKWLKLSAMLNIGIEGSKIIVTTRLMEVAQIMGTILDPYVLKGLSKEQSLVLFKRMAFSPRQKEKENNPEFLSIGEEIVRKCANVPLAIRTMGSLLRGKDKNVWLNIKDRSLADIPENGNHVMVILEISYQHLNSPLKNCFAYCALFPKDYKLKKQTLINLWMAQGFVIPRHRSQSLEESGEEYFLTLLQMGFFQNITRDALGYIESCQMHDLFHDLAIKVAGIECKVAKLEGMEINERTNHLSMGYCLTSSLKVPYTALNLKMLRTFLLPLQIKEGSFFNKSMCHQLLSSNRRLRVLDLHSLELEALPSSIGKLIHLRYLNLSQTSIKELPDSITKLQNLQTLDLKECYALENLPVYLGKLTKLRNLNVSQCWSLTEMPSGLGGLTSLHSMPFMLVNRKNSEAPKSKPLNAQLGDLKYLNCLGGSLHIVIQGVLKDPAYESSEANISSKDKLIELHIDGDKKLYKEVSESRHDEVVLEGLKPHSNLKKLKIEWYRGEKLPSWAESDNLRINLPNLVEIQLTGCIRCQKVPIFSQLPFLKRLLLFDLKSVEYMEDDPYELSQSQEKRLFFPSLETLELSGMDNLKEWWKEVGDDVEVSPSKVQQLSSWNSFSNLSQLTLTCCSNLKDMPHCPKVENLTLVYVHEILSVIKMAGKFEIVSGGPSKNISFGSSSKLKVLTVSNVGDLISLPKECASNIVTLNIDGSDMLNTSSIGEFFKSCNSLRSLTITGCDYLKSISKGLEDLTMLETLNITYCDELEIDASIYVKDQMTWKACRNYLESISRDLEDLSIQEEENISNCYDLEMEAIEDVKDEMPWKAIGNLRTLRIQGLPRLTALPSGFQYLTNLRSLTISSNDGLKVIPEWISCLSSLEEMGLINCGKLTSLPEGFGKLTSLSQLIIQGCSKLRSLPEGFCTLSSLSHLVINDCPGLTERCKGPNGEDWPKIQHIPFIKVRVYFSGEPNGEGKRTHKIWVK